MRWPHGCASSKPRVAGAISARGAGCSPRTPWRSAPGRERCAGSTTSCASSGKTCGRASASSASRIGPPFRRRATWRGSPRSGRPRRRARMADRSRATVAPPSPSLAATAGGCACTATCPCCPASPIPPTAGSEERRGCRGPLQPLSPALDDVDVLEHAHVDVAVDDELAGLVLLDALDPGLCRGVAHDPRDGHIAHVGLHDLLGLLVGLETFLGVASVPPGLQLLVEGVVDPGLAAAGRLLAVERVEVLVVRVRVVHEPA